MSSDWATDAALDAQHAGDPWAPAPAPTRAGAVTAYLDIETATAAEVLWDGLRAAGLVSLGELTEAGQRLVVPPTALAWLVEHAADRALDPIGGRVVCWALITSDGREWVRSDHDERTLLQDLAEVLDRHVQPERIVAHNGHGFDFPFLRARSLALGLYGLARAMWQSKPWDGALVDTQDPSWLPHPKYGRSKEWRASLDGAAELLGIVRPPQLGGEQVPAAWYQGRREEVEFHCLDDVRVLREVTRRLAAGRGGA